jgi:5-methylthioadenosine/S-adenosylhomocysteine deaminase
VRCSLEVRGTIIVEELDIGSSKSSQEASVKRIVRTDSVDRRREGERKLVEMLIKNGTVITMDSTRRMIENGAVAIQDKRILDVGPTDELERRYKAEEVIDAAGMLVLPGLINAHAHAFDSLIRGVGDDMALVEVHEKIFNPTGWHPRAAVNPKHVYCGSLLSCLEYIKTGSTCVVNQNTQPQETAKAVEQAGIRGVLAPIMMDSWIYEEKPLAIDRAAVIAENAKFIKSWHGKADGRIRCMFGPANELTVSKELLEETAKLALEQGVGVYIHLAETHEEVELAKRIYGKRSIEAAFEAGLLRRGTVIGHCCWPSEREIILLAKSGATVAHTPTAEMKLSDGLTPVPRLLAAGANVALGTDSAQCNGSNDMMQELKVVALLHKVTYPFDAEVIPAERALEMATINGAKAVMQENEIGSLEKGKKADLILVDFRKPHLTPILKRPKPNYVSLLIYGALGSDVDTTIVDGKILMLHREVLSLDEPEVVRQAQSAAEELLKDTGIADLSFPWRWTI